MRLQLLRSWFLSVSITVVATVFMLTLMSEPVAKAEPQVQAVALAVPLVEALIKAAPSISSFFQKLFPDPKKPNQSQKGLNKTVSDAQNDGKKQLEGSVAREKVLATVLRASAGAATGTASMSQMVANHTITTEGEKVELRQKWSAVSNKLKKIATAAPNLDIFQAGSEQKLRLETIIDYSGSMPEEVLKEIEGKDTASCQALQKSLSDLGKALQELNDAGAEELNVIANSLATLTLPEKDQTLENGKKKADDLNNKAFANIGVLMASEGLKNQGLTTAK